MTRLRADFQFIKFSDMGEDYSAILLEKFIWLIDKENIFTLILERNEPLFLCGGSGVGGGERVSVSLQLCLLKVTDN